MTCGIYILKFKSTDMVYVGQSIDIENRYKIHINNLKNKTSSIKLNQAYELYGLPDLKVLLECCPEELNNLENEAIEIYNSYNNGFNSLEHAEDMPKYKPNLKGEDNAASVYTNNQILEAAKLMCDYTLNLQQISNITGIKSTTIRKIAQGIQHRWIAEKYPELWDTIQSVKDLRNKYTHSNHGDKVRDKFCAKARGVVYPLVVSPTGQTHNIENLTEFCRVHALQASNMRKIFKGERTSHKGWTLLNTPGV